MSKLCMKRRQKRREDLQAKYAEVRNEMSVIIRDPEASLEDKETAQRKMQTIPRDSAKARSRNRCWMTGRGNGVYSKIGLCRNMFRKYAMQGDLPGIRKSSW